MHKALIRSGIICLLLICLTQKCSGSELFSKDFASRRKPGIVLKNTEKRNDSSETNVVDKKRFSSEAGSNRVTLSGSLKPSTSDSKNKTLTIAIILPHTNFGVREYKRVTNAAINNLHRGRGQRFEFLKKYQFGVEQVKSTMMTLTPSPTGG